MQLTGISFLTVLTNTRSDAESHFFWLVKIRRFILHIRLPGQADSATFLEINHDAHTVSTETVAIVAEMNEDDMETLSPTDEAVEARLTSPVVTTFVDTEKIAFERNKSGFIPGWRSDKSENVSGYECKVFTG